MIKKWGLQQILGGIVIWPKIKPKNRKGKKKTVDETGQLIRPHTVKTLKRQLKVET